MMQKKPREEAAWFHSGRFPCTRCVTGEGFLAMKLLLCVIGLLLVIEGLPYFAFPDQMKRWMKLVIEIPSGRLRPIGLLAMVLGLIVAYLSNS
jgi:uncharacterized protein